MRQHSLLAPTHTARKLFLSKIKTEAKAESRLVGGMTLSWLRLQGKSVGHRRPLGNERKNPGSMLKEREIACIPYTVKIGKKHDTYW